MIELFAVIGIGCTISFLGILLGIWLDKEG